MSKNEIKKVSNLTVKIGKAMDIIGTKDFKEIDKNLPLFEQVEQDSTRQMKNYITNPRHELDFTVNDLSDLADAILDFIKNDQYEFTYTKWYKYFEKLDRITTKDFVEFTQISEKKLKIDTVLRQVYKRLSYNALMYSLWENSEDKKPFDVQITELLKSFL